MKDVQVQKFRVKNDIQIEDIHKKKKSKQKVSKRKSNVEKFQQRVSIQRSPHLDTSLQIYPKRSASKREHTKALVGILEGCRIQHFQSVD